MKNIKSYDEVNEGIMDTLKSLFTPNMSSSPTSLDKNLASNNMASTGGDYNQHINELSKWARLQAGIIIKEDPQLITFKRYLKAFCKSAGDSGYGIDQKGVHEIALRLSDWHQEFEALAVLTEVISKAKELQVKPMTKEEALKLAEPGVDFRNAADYDSIAKAKGF